TLKGGLIHMTRHLAVYWARDNVRVNCLSPGPFPSEKASAAMVERLCTKSPMRRMGRPSELKGAIVFLASDASSYMTGQNLTIDGGWTAWGAREQVGSSGIHSERCDEVLYRVPDVQHPVEDGVREHHVA